jgi:hypothetical protein
LPAALTKAFAKPEFLVQEHPDDCRGHYVLALAIRRQDSRPANTIAELRKVMTLAPGYDPSWEEFTSFP